MEKKVANLVKILGIGINEILMDIELDIAIFDSIEVDKNDKVILHIFEEDDMDISVDFSDLTDDDQLKIFKSLSVILYN